MGHNKDVDAGYAARDLAAPYGPALSRTPDCVARSAHDAVSDVMKLEDVRNGDLLKIDGETDDGLSEVWYAEKVGATEDALEVYYIERTCEMGGSLWRFDERMVQEVSIADVLEHVPVHNQDFKAAWKTLGFRMLDANTLLKVDEAQVCVCVCARARHCVRAPGQPMDMGMALVKSDGRDRQRPPELVARWDGGGSIKADWLGCGGGGGLQTPDKGVWETEPEF